MIGIYTTIRNGVKTMFNKQELETLNSIATYLRVHNNVALYNNLKEIIDKIMRYREKDNARKLKYVNEKRKIDKNYARENSRKKEVLK